MWLPRLSHKRRYHFLGTLPLWTPTAMLWWKPRQVYREAICRDSSPKRSRGPGQQPHQKPGTEGSKASREPIPELSHCLILALSFPAEMRDFMEQVSCVHQDTHHTFSNPDPQHLWAQCHQVSDGIFLSDSKQNSLNQNTSKKWKGGKE